MPSTNTLCSYIASSAPRQRGARRSSSSMLEGRWAGGPLAEGERRGLGERVGRERSRAVLRQEEIHGNEPCPLVKQLVERVLAVRARGAPHHGSRGVVDLVSFAVDPLSVRFHLELLEI